VAEGPQAMQDTGRELMRHAFGTDMLRRVVRIEVTGWRTDPWSRGSYAHCLPGRAAARGVLATPFDDRIRFAGEHLWPACFATAHGAWLSGETVAASLTCVRPA
jgi:monoamine oxidase